MKRTHSIFVTTVLLSLCFISLGCGPQHMTEPVVEQRSLEGLADRGILPLSTKNPYLGPNLFLPNNHRVLVTTNG